MSELLQPLLGTIEEVRSRVQAPSRPGGWNEAQTRASLIDPVLRALDWDVADPAQVRHEHKANQGDGRADYSLLKEDGSPAAVVEAKALGKNLDKAITQTVTYATEQGAPRAAVTDGDRWLVYDVFRPVAIREKQLLDVRLAQTDPQLAALSLLELWRHNVSGGAMPPPPPPPPSDWYPLTDRNLFSVQKPRAIWFPDESPRPIKHWQQVLIQTAAWLYRCGALTDTREPVKLLAKRRPMVAANDDPRRKSEEHLYKPIPDTRHFAFIAANKKGLVRWATSLTEHGGKNAADIKVQRGR